MGRIAALDGKGGLSVAPLVSNNPSKHLRFPIR